jgi:hypothetical protein
MEQPINKKAKIAWQSLEHSNHRKKGSDWFWALWIVAIGSIVLSFYFGNVLFGIIITLFAITSALMVNKKPELHSFEISRKGVRAGTFMYPYSNLESFWVEDTDYEDRIIFRTKKSVQTVLIIPFDSTETDPELIRDFLLDYLDEEELEEPLHQKFMEFLGF